MASQLPSPDNQSYTGAADPTSATSEQNRHAFLIGQMINRSWTSTLVLVKAVTNSGAAAPVGFVDVQPMVAQIDGDGKPTPHGTIFNLPYFRIQGGANAVIIDPQVGDIGIAVFASHDISSVKINKAPANPGSRRRFDPADGLYLGGVLNGVPTQYVAINADGVTITSAKDVIINSTAGKTIVNAQEVDLISANVNLGATGGKKVVLDGDPVSGGVVHASSTKVKAV